MAVRYSTIVADPPWEYDRTGVSFHDADSGEFTGTGLPYETMTLGQIADLPVSELAAPEAHLYLWTTNRYLPDAFQIVERWGFTYSSTLAWCKQPRGWSTGGTFQNNLEFVLFCRERHGSVAITSYLADAAERRGLSVRDVNRAMGTSDMAGWWLSRLPHRSRIPTLEQWASLKHLLGLDDRYDEDVQSVNQHRGITGRSTTCWWQWNRGEHSAKPEAFLDVVESVSPGPYLEMFSRRARLGWTTWGNESLHGELVA